MRLPILLLSISAAAFAQAHSYSQADIDEGARRYRLSCVGCHGAEGAAVSGIDLARAKFKRASTDEDLVQVIMNGVPGTGMPPTPITPTRAYFVVAFLRSMNNPGGNKSIAAPNGDISRGKALFETKAACAGCHRIRGQGGRSGPDLGDAGLILRAIEIETALLDPDAGYTLSARPIRAVRKDGTAITGLLLNQDSYTIQMQDQQGNLLSLNRSDLLEATPAKSFMPSYRGKLDAQELADIVAYIGSLKGAQ